MMLLGIAFLLLPIWLIILAVQSGQARNETGAIIYGVSCVPVVLIGITVLCGLKLVNPNMAKVVLLFGRYVGSIRDAGFFLGQPVHLDAQHFAAGAQLQHRDPEGERLARQPDRDRRGSRMARPKDTAQAAFDVENYDRLRPRCRASRQIRTTAGRESPLRRAPSPVPNLTARRRPTT